MKDFLGQPFEKGGQPVAKPQTHRERQLAINVKADLEKMFPKYQESDIDRLVNSLKKDISTINRFLLGIDAAVKAKGTDHDRKFLMEQTQTLYLQALEKYTKDEMHLLFTCMLADLSIKEIV